MVDFGKVLDFGSSRQSGTEYKNALLKKSILMHLADNSGVTIAELAKELNVSIPTVTKLLADLKEEGYLEDNGKIETAGGRRPNIFGLASDALYVVGVDVQRKQMEMVLKSGI